MSLPVLDLSRSEGEHRDDFLRELRDAARDYGFFYLQGHGISQQYQQDMLLLARQFFALSHQEKMRWQWLIHRIFAAIPGWAGN